MSVENHGTSEPYLHGTQMSANHCRLLLVHATNMMLGDTALLAGFRNRVYAEEYIGNLYDHVYAQEQTADASGTLPMVGIDDMFYYAGRRMRDKYGDPHAPRSWSLSNPHDTVADMATAISVDGSIDQVRHYIINAYGEIFVHQV
jgi:hypothetical protein